jgi:hypothetical protein
MLQLRIAVALAVIYEDHRQLAKNDGVRAMSRRRFADLFVPVLAGCRINGRDHGDAPTDIADHWGWMPRG